MPPTALRHRTLDERAWSVATKSSPVVIQVILGVTLLATWLLGHWSPMAGDDAEGPHLAVIAAVTLTAVGAFAAAAVLFRKNSSTARGIGLSTAACAAIALIGAIPYALWLL